MMMKYFLTFILLIFFFTAKADYINDGRQQYYGHIIAMDQTTVTIKLNCTGDEKSFAWNQISGILFNDQCTHPGYDFSSSPVTADLDCKKKTVFTIKFKELPDVSYADSVKLVNGVLNIHFINNKGKIQLSGNHFQDKVEWMMEQVECVDELKKDFQVPHN